MNRKERTELATAIHAATGLLVPRAGGPGYTTQEDVRRAVAILRALRFESARAVADSLERQIPFLTPLDPGTTVGGCPLHCGVTAVECVARQIHAEIETRGAPTTRACRRRADPDRPRELARHDGKRGTAASRPTCTTVLCSVGACVRAVLGDTAEARAMAARAPRDAEEPS